MSLFDSPRLIADIGGTYARFALETAPGSFEQVASLRSAEHAELDLRRFQGCVPVEMWSGRPFPAVGELPYFLTFGTHGYYWFRLTSAEQVAAGEGVSA